MKIQNMLAQSAQQLFANIDVNKRAQGTDAQQSITTLPDLSGLSEAAGKGVKFVLQQGIQLTDDEVAQIAEFMDDNPGTVAEKLTALSVVLEKKLPLSQVVIGDVHTARRVSLADFLVDSPARPKTTLGDSKQPTDGATNIAQRVVAERLDQLINQLFETAVDDQPRELRSVNRNETTGKAQFVDLDKSIDERPPTAEADNSSKALTSSGDAGANNAIATERRAEDKSFDSAIERGDVDEVFIDFLADQIQQLMVESPLVPDNKLENVQHSVDNPAVEPYKLLLEETVTPKLVAVKASFDDFKQASLNELAQIEDAANQMTVQQRAEALGKLIDKLDSAIMKSEIGMYVSMKVERDMLKQSSELRDARNLLTAGKTEDAEKIVRTVVKEIEKMQFKPTLKRVIALGNPIALSDEELKYNDIVKWAKRGIDGFSKTEKSVAGLVHYLRRLGVNHEVETFQQTYRNDDKSKQAFEKRLPNLKQLLLTMAKDEQDSATQGKTNKLLSHINGQQLQLKVVDRVQEQQLMLSVPLNLNGRISDVKVYIKAQDNDLKIDWQNFNMFFVLDTKHFDDVGVKVVAVDKKVRIDVYNDDIERKSAIMTLANQLKDYVESVGYNVTGLHFAAWRGQHPNQTAERKPQVQGEAKKAQFRKGRVDFKI